MPITDPEAVKKVKIDCSSKHSPTDFRHTLNDLEEMFGQLIEGVDSKRDISIAKFLHLLQAQLNSCRSSLPPDQWKLLIESARQHRFFQLMLEDPMTRHSFLKPRSYPGDAMLIDYIYEHDYCSHQLIRSSDIGQKIYNFNWMSSPSLAVRARRRLIAEAIGQTLVLHDSPRILSVAAGHFREADLIPSVLSRHLEFMLIIDQDAESLAMVENYSHIPNRICRQLSVQQILMGKLPESDFDLIYAAGLYDYLKDRVAERLTQILFSKLRSGGRLLIPNFMPTTRNIAYMEMFMDWFLIYRNEEEMQKLMSVIPKEKVSEMGLFVDQTSQICFADITRI